MMKKGQSHCERVNELGNNDETNKKDLKSLINFSAP